MANQQLRDQLEDYKNRQHKNRRLKRISFIVAMCLVAVAIVALVLPGVTLEYGKTSCGKEEHVHTEQCYKQQLACSLPAKGHVHTASCYDDFGALACGQEAVGHIHLASCYDANGKLTCGQEETVHMHTAACVDPATNTLVCNTAEADHVHGETCYALQDGAYMLVCQQPSVGHVHTAVCLDENGQVVCGQKEAIEVEHVHDDTCYVDELVCGKEEHTHNELCYDEITQSIMKNEEKHEAESSASESAEGDTVDEAATGDADLTDGEIAEAKDQGLLFENDAMIVAFDVPDDIKDKVVLKVTEGAEADAAKAAAENGSDAQAGNAVEGQPTSGSPEGNGDEAGDANASADDAAGNSVGNVSINEQVNIDEQNVGNAASGTAADAEEPVWATNLYIQATLDDKPVSDISELGITAKVQMKPAVIAPILDEINYDEVADEIKDETGAEVTIAQLPMNAESYPISERQGEKTETTVITSSDNATVDTDIASNDVAVEVDPTVNPIFTVQYYADVDRFAETSLSTKQALEVIDTSAEANNGMATLPQNGVTPTKKKLNLIEVEGSDEGRLTVEKTTKKEPLYTEGTYSYLSNPSPSYFNKFEENKHYSVTGIWVLKDEKDPSSIEEEDWNVFPVNQDDPENNLASYTFTNNPNAAAKDPKRILLSEGTVIRLVSDRVNKEKTSEVVLHDYDITAYDNKLKKPSVNYKGINSKDNYSGTGSKLAFGNNALESGLKEQTYGGNKINTANNPNDACYGLVEKSLNAQNLPAIKVDSPAIFGDTAAVGKTTYKDYGLVFNQAGDTYTLSRATDGKGTTISPLLDQLRHRSNWNKTKELFSNEFWPLDGAPSHGASGHDPLYGETSLATVESAKSGATANPLPEADYKVNHNGYFGMEYEVDFRLSSDYCGPLDYLFFGDDDLWVFLVDKSGNSQLVMDIGGVHGSVGEYVNLWDYLRNSDGTNKTGDYSLKVFYTERGAAGSSCFMNFTLPTASFKSPERQTTSLQISKQIEGTVKGNDANADFEFRVNLSDASGSPLYDNYSYVIKDSSKNVSQGESATISNGGTLKMKSGQYVVIDGLPIGTKFTVEELDPDKKWSTSSLVNLTVHGDKTASGDIPDSNSAVVSYKNTRLYELPATGGVGTYWYWLGGGALIVAALLLWRRRPIAAAATSGASSAGIARNAADGVCQGTRTRVPNEPRVGNKGVTSSVESECSYGKGDSSDVRQDE